MRARNSTPKRNGCRRIDFRLHPLRIQRKLELYCVTVKFVLLVPVPPGVVTPIGPVFAPDGTSAFISESVITSKLVAATPPNVTFVAPVKVLPLIVTSVPTGPLGGL